MSINIFDKSFLQRISGKIEVFRNLQIDVSNCPEVIDFYITDMNSYVYSTYHGCGDYPEFEDRAWLDKFNNMDMKFQWVYRDMPKYNYSAMKNEYIPAISRVYQVGTRNVYFVANINVNSLIKSIEIYSKSESSYYMLNENFDVPLITNGYDIDIDMIRDRIGKESLNNEGSFLLTMNGLAYQICYVKSVNTGWYFLSIVSLDVLYKNIYPFKHFAMLLSIIGVLVSIVISVITSSRLYHPINLIIRSISKYLKNEIKPESDITYISSAVDHLIYSNLEQEKRYESSKKEIKENYLIRILMQGETFDEFRNILDDFMDYRCYAVATMVFDDKDAFQFDSDDSCGIKPDIRHETINMYDKYIFIFAGDQTSLNINKLRKELDRILSIHDRNNVTFGVGTIVNGVKNIYLSYQQSLIACKYKLIEGWGKVIFYSDVNFNPDKTGIKRTIFSINESKVIRSLHESDSGEIVRYFGSLIEPYSSYKLFDDKIIYTIYYQYLMLLFNYVENNCLHIDKKLNVQVLMKAGTVKEMIENIKEIACEIITIRNSETKYDLLDKISVYIDGNYHKDISLSSMSRKMFISESHLSRIFKEYYNTNF